MRGSSLRYEIMAGFRGAQWTIADIRIPAGEPDRPLPWESGDLVVQSGARVTVAAPPALAGKLEQVIRSADQAALVTDRFAGLVGVGPPASYLIFLAGDREWTTWMGTFDRKDIVGFAQPTGTNDSVVVLHMPALDRASLPRVITHELGHVVTPPGSDPFGAGWVVQYDVWIEGMAEYIAFAGEPVTANARVVTFRAAARRGVRIAGFMDQGREPSSEREKVAVVYGLGHLLMSCLASKFGETKLFRFWSAYVLGNAQVGPAYRYDASKAIFGQDMGTIEKSSLRYIRG